MLVTTSVLATSLLLAAPQDVEPAAAAAKIKVAIKEAPSPAIDAMEKYGRIADKAVTKALAAGLRHRDQEVRAAAIRALRYNEAKTALTELIRVKSNKRILEDAKLAEEYYLAIGQHGSKKTLGLLTAKLHITRRGDKVTGARILALGRVRERAAVEALISFCKSGRRRGRHNSELRLALAALTGHDAHGAESWVRWWQDNKADFVMMKVAPTLPKKLARGWDKVWRVPLTLEEQATEAEEKAKAAEEKAKAREAKRKKAREQREKRKKKDGQL